MMKKLYSYLIMAFYFISFNLIYSVAHSQYRPINPDIEGIYSCQRIEPFADPYLSRSTLDSQKVSLSNLIYFPFRTLTDRNLKSYECSFIQTNNWLGDSIIYNTISEAHSFHFTPIRYNESIKSFELTSSESFELPGNLNIGSTFQINQYIEAKVISENTSIWNGIQVDKQTIRLTNLGNPDYLWEEGDIVITKDQGLYSFPNLQYFPFEWRNCTLSGLTEDKIGLQDFTAKDAYRMGPGDSYTAEYKLSFFGPPGPTFYYDKITCLEIISEDNLYQDRINKREKLQLNYPTLLWEYTVDTITEHIEYEIGIHGRANESLLGESSNITLVILQENGNKFNNEYIDHEGDKCYQEIIDACYGTYTFKEGLTNYFDCSGIFNFENYYLPVSRIVGGIGYGGGNTFDSIKTLKTKVIDNADVSIYPNPSTGIIRLNFNKASLITNYYLIDISGKRNKIEPLYVDINAISFDIIKSGMFYLTGTDRSGNIYKLGKVIINTNN